MPDNNEQFSLHLSSEQQSIVLMELRRDLRDIKNALGPISEWKSKMQGALFIMGFALTLLLGSGGFLTWRWWDSGIEISNVKYQLESQKEKNIVVENQLLNIAKDTAEDRARISALETGAITKHIGK